MSLNLHTLLGCVESESPTRRDEGNPTTVCVHLFYLPNVPFLKWIHRLNRLPPELRLSTPLTITMTIVE